MVFVFDVVVYGIFDGYVDDVKIYYDLYGGVGFFVVMFVDFGGIDIVMVEFSVWVI